MRYPVTLTPAGVIPRDPKLVLRLTPLPPTSEAQTPVASAPCASVGLCDVVGSIVMHDGFGNTGPGSLDGRTTASGGSYTQVTTVGNGEPDTFVVEGGLLRRADFSEVGGDSFGEAFFYTDQQPATTRFYMEAMVRFNGKINGSDPPGPLYSFVHFHQACDDPGASTVIGGISSQGLGNDATLQFPDDTPYTTTAGTWYRTRLFVDELNTTLCINGEVVGTRVLEEPITLPVGFDTFNFGGDENFDIDYLTIADVPDE